jgi:hypothetical protein
MSDFLLPETPPLVTPAQPRDTGRMLLGMAEHFRGIGMPGEARRLERQSQWWLAYAIALSQIRPEATP